MRVENLAVKLEDFQRLGRRDGQSMRPYNVGGTRREDLTDGRSQVHGRNSLMCHVSESLLDTCH